MTTSTRECHVMDIGIERDLLKEPIEEEMETLAGPDIDQKESTWEGSIEEAMKKFRPELQEKLRNKRYIYHLPAFSKLMKSSNVLTPKVVSFGPDHHGDQNLKLVEDYKQRSLLRFLYKAKLPLGNVIRAMKEVVEELQAHYEYVENKWKNKMEFLKIMITDGCFMLELLQTDSSLSHDRNESGDPIFGRHAARHIIPRIKKDMLMLGNQLPLLALKVLLSVEAQWTNEPLLDKTNNEINNLVFKFFEMKDMLYTTPDLGLHVLDLYRKGLIENDTQPQQCEYLINTGARNESMLTAVKLHESLIQFKPSGSNKMTSISFDKGILKLPHLIIDDATESTLLNFMAFERIHTDLPNVVTSYICFLGELIHSASDAQLLRSANIIHLHGVTDKDAAEILNRLTKEVVHEYWTSEVYYTQLKLESYSKRTRGRVSRLLKTRVKKWFSILMNLYFSNPWSTIGIIAAAVALVLTFIQTYYAILSYKYSKK